MPISNIYELGKQTLLAYQSAIQTTSGNISNSNNENYARRRVELSQLVGGFSGIGISVEKAVRMRQEFAEHQLWSENQHLNEFITNNELLRQIEGVYAEDTESGITSLLTEFWNSWNNLANDPENEYSRAIVRDKGVLLSNSFRRIHGDLVEMQDQIRPEIDAHITEVNQTLEELSRINQRIRSGRSDELLDQRDQLLKKLSSEIDVKVKEQDSGMVNIYLDGYVLISDDTINTIRAQQSSTNDENKVTIYLGASDKTINVGSGKLKALIKAHNEEIPDQLHNLDLLAVHIADSVNTLHEAGENLAGSTNISFFASDVSGAADFRVNSAIVNDLSLIASRRPAEGDGSGSIAQDISDLQYASTLNGSTDLEFYHSVMTQLGNKIQEADFQEQSQQLIVEQLQNQRDSVTGVSLDEEMTHLVQFQQAYQAAAKIVTTVDEMVNTVLGMH